MGSIESLEEAAIAIYCIVDDILKNFNFKDNLEVILIDEKKRKGRGYAGELP
jgi:tetraacyldisaccharide-1-P 4'-kinase